MSALKNLTLGARTLALQPRLLLAAWLLHLTFALAASWFPWREIIRSLEHRPVASFAFRYGFNTELFVDWMFAYGKPLAAYQNAALVMALIYGLGVVLLESATLPAWLWPFERRHGAFFSPLIHIAICSLGVWLLLAAAILATRSIAPPVALIAGVIAAVFLRVILNLWKCARVSGDAGLGDALAAAARRPGAVTMLAAATLVTAILYAAAAAAAGWFSLVYGSVILSIIQQQVLILAAVLLRLWLQASTVVLWRRTALQSL